MKFSYISFFVLIFYTQLGAQLLTPYTLYRDQWGVINPASLSNNFTLDEYIFSVALTDRHQWLGNGFNWDYSPNTQLLNFENVQDRNRILIGGHVLQDRTGDLSVLGAYGRFAYLIPMDRFAKKALSVGLAVGVVQNRSRIDGSDTDYFKNNEAGIVPGSVIKPDVSLGVYYYDEDIWYFGVSIPQLLSLDTEFGDDQIAYSLKQPRHFYVVGGGYIPFDFFGFGDGSSFLELSGWARYLPIRQSKADSFNHLFRVDGSARYQHNQIAWIGLGLGSSLALDYTFLHAEFGFIGGEQLNLANGQLKIGLALDFIVGDAIQRLGPSAEINVMYAWY
ncbi:MAG: PorP/SprF family type IX secretion system membrane protein [Saprospiraceae bacterium]